MFLDCTTEVQFSILMLHLQTIQQIAIPSAAKSCLFDKFLRQGCHTGSPQARCITQATPAPAPGREKTL